jgi:hypothetical protein
MESRIAWFLSLFAMDGSQRAQCRTQLATAWILQTRRDLINKRRNTISLQPPFTGVSFHILQVSSPKLSSYFMSGCFLSKQMEYLDIDLFTPRQLCSRHRSPVSLPDPPPLLPSPFPWHGCGNHRYIIAGSSHPYYYAILFLFSAIHGTSPWTLFFPESTNVNCVFGKRMADPRKVGCRLEKKKRASLTKGGRSDLPNGRRG